MSVSLKLLDEQVMVLTGAASGIGLATALSAAKQGVKLVLASRSDQTLKEIVRQITSSSGQAISVVADVGDRQQVQRIAEAAVQKFGRIDTWINDAGVSIYGQHLQQSARRIHGSARPICLMRCGWAQSAHG